MKYVHKAFEYSTGNSNTHIARINRNDNSVLDWKGKEDASRKAVCHEMAWNRDE